jgi:VWFA-related protein
VGVQDEIREAVKEHSLGSGTAINSAIRAAAAHAGKQAVRGRRAVLIVTDNLSLNYRVPDEDVIRALYAADTVLNAILIGRHRRPDPPRSGPYLNPDFSPSDVFKLAEQTGGEAMESNQVADSFEQMIERIRARYSIQYPAPPAETGVFRRIRVELSPSTRKRYANAVIRARGGYFAAK